MVRKAQNLKIKFRKITIIPLMVFGILTLAITSILIYTSMRNETKDGLQQLSHTFLQICDLSGEGDYSMDNQILYKGGQPFDADYRIVDEIKHSSNTDATIFWDSRRVSTTIKDASGKRAIGTRAASEVREAVLNKGESYFSDHVIVNNQPYFGQYVPLRNADHTIVGMLFVGKSRDKVLHMIYRSIMIISAVLFLMIFFVSLCSLTFSRKIVQSLNGIKDFLGDIAKGDVKATLDKSVLERNDELGEMGHFSVVLQSSITQLINTDALTGLSNRRCITQSLHEAVEEYKNTLDPFIIVIGDIDDFKKVNDTYGHLIGDEVLKHVSTTFMNTIHQGDIAARWGGEEFLFLLKHKNKAEAAQLLTTIQHDIRYMKCLEDKYQELKITMTFGVCEYHGQKDIEFVLKCVDEKLYAGKLSGKDQIVLYD